MPSPWAIRQLPQESRPPTEPVVLPTNCRSWPTAEVRLQARICNIQTQRVNSKLMKVALMGFVRIIDRHRPRALTGNPQGWPNRWGAAPPS